MDLLDAGLLMAAGFAAGTINALAGGGTIFTFSALLSVGLPPVTANATSACSVLPGQIASALAYRREIGAVLRRLLPLAVVSAIGGTAGGVLLLASGDETFRVLVPFLILFATLLFIAAPQVARLGERLRVAAGPRVGALPTAVQGAVAVYGGYFGAGMGIMMLASLSLTEGRDYHAVNAAKNLLAVVMQGLAVVVFLLNGTVDFTAAALVAVSSIAGGWISVWVGKAIPARHVRRFVIAVGLGLSAWYFLTL